MENSNEPAFSRPYSRDVHSGDRPENHYTQKGLTKREYFAAMAMQGILAHSAQQEQFRLNDYGIASERIAEISIDCADELLKQLSK